jgi:hypothetical protein
MHKKSGTKKSRSATRKHTRILAPPRLWPHHALLFAGEFIESKFLASFLPSLKCRPCATRPSPTATAVNIQQSNRSVPTCARTSTASPGAPPAVCPVPTAMSADNRSSYPVFPSDISPGTFYCSNQSCDEYATIGETSRIVATHSMILQHQVDAGSKRVIDEMRRQLQPAQNNLLKVVQESRAEVASTGRT